jgi:hypothetical protein
MKQYPELQRFASPAEAKKAMRAWQKRMLKMPLFWLGLVGYTCCVGGLVFVILISLRPWLGLSQATVGGIVGGVTGGSGGVGLAWFWRHRCRRFLRRQVLASGVPICLKCGYDLRGSKGRCPECGTEFESSGVEGSGS